MRPHEDDALCRCHELGSKPGRGRRHMLSHSCDHYLADKGADMKWQPSSGRLGARRRAAGNLKPSRHNVATGPAPDQRVQCLLIPADALARRSRSGTQAKVGSRPLGTRWRTFGALHACARHNREGPGSGSSRCLAPWVDLSSIFKGPKVLDTGALKGAKSEGNRFVQVSGPKKIDWGGSGGVRHGHGGEARRARTA